MRAQSMGQGRNRSTVPAAIAGLALIANGCYTTRSIGIEELRGRHQSETVTARLNDNTHVVFEEAQLVNDVLRGKVVACQGLLCDQIRRDGGVGLADVSELSIREVSGTGVALAFLGVVVVAGGVALLVMNGQADKPAPPPPPSQGSCPRVYSFDGTAWVLDSGTYSGAFFDVAQRTDTDLLEHLAPVKGEYRLRVANELAETDHTDAVALEVVDHPAGSFIVPEASGHLLTFTAPRPPLAAHDLRGADALAKVSARDGVVFQSDVSNRRPDRLKDARDGLILEFAKPADATVAKLWLAGMNTPWAVMAAARFVAQGGPLLPIWYARLGTDARQKLLAFMARETMLTVSVRTPTGWSERGGFLEAGPELRKDQALVIPIADVPGDRLVVRLEAPVGFWTIDSVALDTSADVPIDVRRISPRTAVADDGRDLAPLLAAIDGRRYSTRPGASAELTFDALPPPPAGQTRSYVLLTTGYYEPDLVLDPDGNPAALEALMATPGAASRWALAQLNVTLARVILKKENRP